VEVFKCARQSDTSETTRQTKSEQFVSLWQQAKNWWIVQKGCSTVSSL